jgi:hypothetical protein
MRKRRNQLADITGSLTGPVIEFILNDIAGGVLGGESDKLFSFVLSAVPGSGGELRTVGE